MSRKGQWGFLVVIIIIAFFVALYNIASEFFHVIYTSKSLSILLTTEREIASMLRIYIKGESRLAENATLSEIISSLDLGEGIYKGYPICGLPDRSEFEKEWLRIYSTHLAENLRKHCNKNLRIEVYDISISRNNYVGKLAFYMSKDNFEYKLSIDYKSPITYDLNSIYNYYKALYDKYLYTRKKIERCLRHEGFEDCCEELGLRCITDDRKGFIVDLDTEYGKYICIGFIET